MIPGALNDYLDDRRREREQQRLEAGARAVDPPLPLFVVEPLRSDIPLFTGGIVWVDASFFNDCDAIRSDVRLAQDDAA